MDDQRVGAILRAVRIRQGRRQVDVAAAAGVSAQTVSRIERGHCESLSLKTLRAVARALDVRLDLAPWSRHGDLYRFATADHARLVESIVRDLVELGWQPRAEVSFSEFGERGFVDVLAWHAPTRTVLVVEAKTAIVDVGEVIGVLDRKRRLAPRIAARLGWETATVGCALVVLEGRTNRRRLASHRSTFASAFPAGGRAFRAWLRRPRGSISAIATWPDSHPRATGRRRVTAKRRVSTAPRSKGPAGAA